MSVVTRFLAKVEKNPESGCWIWRGSQDGRGYGHIGLYNKMVKAHRLSYLLFKGPIPAGLFVCHACDTPLCVNPDHLWVGTAFENTRDMERKGRAAYYRPGWIEAKYKK